MITLPPDSEIYLYRTHTRAILRRFYRVSHEIGRLPSLLGGQVFRARVTSYRLHTFEDLVIFVHDVERCLMELLDHERKLITHVIFQGYTVDEAAAILPCAPLTARRGLRRGIDQLSRAFLQRGILCLFPTHEPEYVADLESPLQRAIEDSPPEGVGPSVSRTQSPASAGRLNTCGNRVKCPR